MELVARGNLEDDNVRGFFSSFSDIYQTVADDQSAALGVQFEV